LNRVFVLGNVLM